VLVPVVGRVLAPVVWPGAAFVAAGLVVFEAFAWRIA
jgi:hypothetical protein